MNPSCLDALHEPSGDSGSVVQRSRWFWRGALRWTLVPFQFLYAVMLLNMLHPYYGRNFKVEDGSLLRRMLRGIVYRLLLIPVILVLFAAILVYTGTHPVPVPPLSNPTSQGIYYEPVTFRSDDNVHLEGWLIPVLDARRILARKEKALTEKHPAVVLVHDYANNRQQMLPLVAPLHDAGFVVLVVTLRGNGFSGRGASTFGLAEANDVKAAVDLLRRTPFVNPAAVGVIGVGTGGTAALLAAERDVNIGAVIADNPSRSGDETIARHIGPQQSWLQWINPLCKWSFDIAYGVDSSDINLDHHIKALANRHVFIFDGERPVVLQRLRARQITDYLSRHLRNRSDAVSQTE